MEPLQPTAVREILGTGVPRTKLRGVAMAHPHWGVVCSTDIDHTEVLARIHGAVPLLKDGCAIGGWAAAYLQGVRYLDGQGPRGPLPVTVHAPHQRRLRHRDGVTITRRRLHAGEVIEFEGIPVTTIARAVYDMALDAPNVREATVAFDMGLSTTTEQAHTTPANVERVLAAHHKTRGINRARQGFDLSSARAASPWETRTRDLATESAGIDPWLINQPVFSHDEKLLGVADLLNLRAGLVLESDGAGHREEVAHAGDNKREEKFERKGLIVVRVAAIDHRDRLGTRQRIRLAYDDGVRTAGREQNWTLDKPGWWWHWPPARRWD